MNKNYEKYHRGSLRLKGYDYSSNGTYFITLCTKNRQYYFEEFEPLKNIIQKEWKNLEERFSNIILDEFVIMPNHIHGIIFIQNQNDNSKKVSLGDIVGSFKSKCITEWLKYIKENNVNTLGKFWQENYYEKIIRNETSLLNIRNYIKDNPVKWEMMNDEFYKNHNLI